MKRLLGIFIFVLISATVFAEVIFTSEGDYQVGISYVGENCGQKSYEARIKEIRNRARVPISNPNLEKLSKGQWECVYTVLKHYETTAGDTYEILISRRYSLYPDFYLYCEFTSDTEFVWWGIEF